MNLPSVRAVIADLAPGPESRPLSFDSREVFDLALSWVVVSAVLTFVIDYSFSLGAVDLSTLPALLLINGASFGLAFLLHELAHKVGANRLGYPAAFRANYPLLFGTAALSFLGIVFLAPGAVMFRPNESTTRREVGIVKAVGPVTNFVLAALTVPLTLGLGALGLDLLAFVAARGAIVNVGLGVFNLIPFGPLDGNGVRKWSWTAWGVLVAVGLGLGVVAYTLVGTGALTTAAL